MMIDLPDVIVDFNKSLCCLKKFDRHVACGRRNILSPQRTDYWGPLDTGKTTLINTFCTAVGLVDREYIPTVQQSHHFQHVFYNHNSLDMETQATTVSAQKVSFHFIDVGGQFPGLQAEAIRLADAFACLDV